jgi:hypothetical protein
MIDKLFLALACAWLAADIVLCGPKAIEHFANHPHLNREAEN